MPGGRRSPVPALNAAPYSWAEHCPPVPTSAACSAVSPKRNSASQRRFGERRYHPPPITILKRRAANPALHLHASRASYSHPARPATRWGGCPRGRISRLSPGKHVLRAQSDAIMRVGGPQNRRQKVFAFMISGGAGNWQGKVALKHLTRAGKQRQPGLRRQIGAGVIAL